MPLIDVDEVILTDPSIDPLLVRFGSSFRSERRRTNRANSSRVATCSECEYPLLATWVEVNRDTA